MYFAALRRLASQPQAIAALQAIADTAGPKPFQLVKLSEFSSSAAAGSGKLLGACVFERLPLVMPAEPEWEVEHASWQTQMLEKYFKILPREFTDPKQTAEHATGDAGSRWQPAPLETDADRSGDRRSLRRRLDQRIFLLVRPAGRADAAYTLPHAAHQQGETIRQTAERVLGDTISLEGVQPYFVGNAPAGHVETEAGTMFFNRCQLIAGKPALRPGGSYSDYAWVAKDELQDYIKHQPTLEVLQKML